MKDLLPDLTPEQWRAQNELALKKAQDNYSGAWDNYARKRAAWTGDALGISWEVANSILRAPAVGLRAAVGYTGEFAGLWDTPVGKEFRYNNLPAFHGYSTFGHLLIKEMVADPVAVFSAMGGKPAGMVPVLKKVEEQWLSEYENGFLWAKANPEAADEIALMTFDPIIASGMLSGAAKTKLFQAEMRYMVPVIEKLRAATGGKFVLEASALHGNDIINDSFRHAVKSAFDSGASAETIAAELWAQSYRAAPWSKELSDLPVIGPASDYVGKFFRRSGQLVSSDIRDIAVEKEIYQQAIGHDRIAALEAVPKFDTLWSDTGATVGEKLKRFIGKATEGDIIQELMEKVPRTAQDTVQSFEANYSLMVRDGQIAEVPAKTFEKAKKAVASARLGYEDHARLRRGSKPGVHEESYSAIVDKRKALASAEQDLEALEAGGAFDPSFASKLPIEEGPLVSKSGRPISAQLRRSDNTILLNPEQIAIDFKNKAWTKPRIEGVKALPASTFKTEDEFRQFLIHHEAAHVSLPRGGRPPGAYENAVNDLALKRMRGTFSNSGWGEARVEVNKLYSELQDLESSHNAAVYRTGGPGAMFEYKERYSPSKFLVDNIEGKSVPQAGGSSTVFRNWELERTGGPGRFAAATDFRNWLASQSTKLSRADKIDEFVAKASAYKITLRQAFEEAAAAGDRVAEFKFRHQYRMVQSLVRDLKQWKTTPDFIRAAKAHEPIPVLKVYDKILNVIRTAQVLGSPSVLINNALDSNVTKNAIAGGSVGWKEFYAAAKSGKPVPAYAYDGRLLSFAAEPAEAIVGNTNEATLLGLKTLGKARSAMAEVLNATEMSARNYLGQVTYDRDFSRMVNAGISPDAAHSRAYVSAKANVSTTHFDYGVQSTFDKAARRVWMYPVFGLRNMAFHATMAWRHPAEYFALAKLREAQFAVSDDKDGRFKIPGFDYAADPIARTSVARVLDILINTKAELNPDDHATWQQGRVLQAVMGTFTPPAQTLLESLGALKPSIPGATSSLENVIGALNKTMTGKDAIPSDWAYGIIGVDPSENRQRYLERRAMLLGVAAARDGYTLHPDQAMAMAEHFDNVAKYSSWAGLSLVPSTPRLNEVKRDLKDAQFLLVNSDPEFADSRKAMILSQREYSDLDVVLPKTPSERVNGTLFYTNLEAAKARAAEAVVGPLASEAQEAESKDRISDFIDILGKSPKLAPFRAILGALVPPAGATDTTIGPPGSHPKPGESYRVGYKGAIVPEQLPADMSLRDKLAKMQAAQRPTEFINSTFLAQLNLLQSDEQIATAIDGFKDKDGYNFAPALLDQLKEHPLVAGVREQYRAFKSDGADGNLLFATPAVREFRREFSASYREWVGEGGVNAPARAAASVDAVRAAAARGEIFLPGVPPSAISANTLRLAQRDIDGVLYGARKRREDERSLDYPDFNKVIGQLQDATRQPIRMDSVLEEVRGMVAAGARGEKGPGTLPGDFAQQLDETPQHRNLSENVGIAASYRQADQVLAGVFDRDPKTQSIYGINEPALYAIAYNPKYDAIKPFVSAARAGYYGPQLQSAINRGMAQLPAEDQQYMERVFNTDPAAIQAHFEEDGKLQMGGRLALHDIIRNLPAFAPDAPAPVTGVALPEMKTARTQDVKFQSPVMTMTDSGLMRILPPTPPRLGAVSVSDRFVSAAKANIATDFAGTVSGPPVTGDPRAWFEGPSQANRAPFRSVSQIITTSISQSQAARRNWEASGLPGDEPPGGFSATLISNAKLQWNNSKTPEQAAMGISAVQAGLSLAGTFDLLPSEGDSASAINGFMVGASTMMTLGGPANPLAVGAGVAAGIYTGLKGSGSRGPSREQAENLRINQERLNLQREQFAASQRQQDIRDIRTRETDLARSMGAATPAQRAAIGEKLAAFQRRPSFQSRIGLVDAAERAVGSALKPRW